MNEIDELVRHSGAALRDEVTRTVDVEASLRDLRARRRHRRSRVVIALAAAAAAVAVVGVVGTTRSQRATEPSPAQTPGPAPSAPFVCAKSASVRCLAGGRVRVDRPHPFVVTPPDGFSSDVSADELDTELYRNDTAMNAGVSFLDDVIPARSGGQHMSARQLADWVAARPYLRARPGQGELAPSRTTIDGRPAWEVQVTTDLEPSGRTGGCNLGAQPSCWPVLALPRKGTAPWEIGPWRDMANQYTFIDLPGGATFAISSYAFDGNWAAIDDNQDLIRTLHFPPR